ERTGDVGGLVAAPAEDLARLVARLIRVDLSRHRPPARGHRLGPGGGPVAGPAGGAGEDDCQPGGGGAHPPPAPGTGWVHGIRVGLTEPAGAPIRCAMSCRSNPSLRTRRSKYTTATTAATKGIVRTLAAAPKTPLARSYTSSLSRPAKRSGNAPSPIPAATAVARRVAR